MDTMIKVLELFSGYGGASFGLQLANIPHKCIGYSDIEDCANYIFALNHGEDIPQLDDVTKINPDDLEDFDLLTAGFPCQSFSIAGKREGFKAERKGQLFFEIIRIAEVKHPRWMLLENVQGLLSHDDGKTMKVILDELRVLGYYVNWKLLFSKEHGTPQNRPRVWFACFREKEDYDKFMFPEKEELKITVKDLLEDVVDEKYYLNETQLERINNYNINNEDKGRGFKIEPVTDICTTITSHAHKDNNSVPIFNTAHTKANGSRFKNDGTTFTLEATQSQSLCVADFRYDEGLRPRKDGVAPTLNARKRNDGDGVPMIMDNKTKNPNESGVSNTVRAGGGSGNNILTNYKNRWRRLTPRECFRLMGFFQDQIKFGKLSDSKLYFLAGNGWDINTASKIFTQMFKGNKLNKQQPLGEYI